MFLYLPPTTSEEVKLHISRLKNTLSCGLDSVPVCTLKSVSDLICEPLSNCINNSFLSGKFPQNLKSILVRPLHKKGPKTDASNYRGLNLTSNFSKLFESIFKTRLDDYLDFCGIISPDQHGFTKNKSTSTAVKSLLDFIYRNKFNKLTVLVIMIDFTRAFDSINHSLLFDKLYDIGIRGQALSWVKSYFENRKQVVEIEHVSNGVKSKNLSSELPINAGVFQGTKLACPFFNIFLNELLVLLRPTNGKIVQVVAYADDLTIAVASTDLESTIALANETLLTLHNWCLRNDLQVNENKSNFILIDEKFDGPVPPLHLGPHLLQNSECSKLLGVWIDQKLSWDFHSDDLVKKLRKVTYLFRVIRNSMPLKYLLTLYHSYFASKLRYCIQFWGTSKNLKAMLLLQKRVLRIIFRLKKRASCRSIFSNNKILTSYSLFILESVIQTHKTIGTELQLNKDVHSHNTRNRAEVHVSKTHSRTYFHVKIYNHLPHTIRESCNRKFRLKVQELLAPKSLYNFNEFFDDKFNAYT